jgi:acyl transferase domain-containing protein
MDPHQKILLEVSYQALKDSNLKFKGSNTGVFVGSGPSEFLNLNVPDSRYANEYSSTGTSNSVNPNRISFCFDLKGPSINVDTACSSSASALLMGITSISNNLCDAALICGINLMIHPIINVSFTKLGVSSPDGICKSFDEKANGYVRSEG